MIMNRRHFIKNTAGLGLASMAGMIGLLPAFGQENRITNYGLQLYTVRYLLQENLERTIEKVAEFGYKEVESVTALENVTYLGETAKRLKRALDNNGLECVSRHIDPIHMEPEIFKTIVEDAHMMGQKYIVMGWVEEIDRVQLEQYYPLIEGLNRSSEICKDAGIQFAYHHHEFEFFDFDGVRPFDLIVNQTDAELMKIEMDFYWMRVAKQDPFEWYDKFPGRFPLCHLKDMGADGDFIDVGKGSVDFERNLSRIKQAGFKHFFVEHDTPTDPLETIRYSIETVKKMRIG